MRNLLLVAMVAVACGGSTGPAGPAGPQGPTGPQGQAGTDVLSGRSCSMQAVVGINLLFVYEVVNYTNGHKEVYCLVADGFASYETSLHVFPNGTALPAAQCVVVHDVNCTSAGGCTSGSFEFRNDAPGERVIYHDAGAPQDGTTALFPAAGCVG
jgi:hypothetical protein